MGVLWGVTKGQENGFQIGPQGHYCANCQPTNHHCPLENHANGCIIFCSVSLQKVVPVIDLMCTFHCCLAQRIATVLPISERSLLAASFRIKSALSAPVCSGSVPPAEGRSWVLCSPQ